MLRHPIALVRGYAHRSGLLPRLLAAEVILLALLFAASLALVGRLADTVKASQAASWLLLGKSTGVALDGMLEDGVGDLRDAAAWYVDVSAIGQGREAQSVLDQTASRSPIFTDGVVVVGPDGHVRAADRSHQSALGTDLRATSVPSSTVGGISGSEVWLRGDPSGSTSVALAVPLGPPDAGVMLVGLIGSGHSEPDRVMATAVRLGQSGHAEIVDRECRVVFATEPGHVLTTGEHPTFCRAMWSRGQPGVGSATVEMPEQGDLQGPHLMAFVPLQTMPWALEIGTSAEEAYGPATQLRDGSIAILLVLTGLAVLATIVLARKVVEPVTSLSRVASRIAEGEHATEITTPWGGEIGELARSLETMRVRLAGWASALEEQVRTRTSELEQRNRELGDLYASLRHQEAQRQTLLGRILGAQEDERRRVSRELHDSIGQTFWALTLGLERLQDRSDCPPSLRSELATLQGLAAESLTDLRRLTVALRPAALDDLGLVPAIRRYAELYLNDGHVSYEIAAEGLEERLDPFRETVVYRVVQEAINNVARHSGATRAWIRLQRVGDTLRASVVDNGRGFDRSTREPGVGLQGMGERALLVGGTLKVTSRPGDGTTVELTVPIDRATMGDADGIEEAVVG